jgi:site-specific DNA-methyltransferase (adenine-specific)/site-specific DNA-methyltransferase (cytosine-N4-specific)
MTLIQGDAIEALNRLVDEGHQFDHCLTSPPYWQMVDYGVDGQMGLEPTVEDYLSGMVQVFGLVRQLLPQGGICWIVVGDTFNNYSPVRLKGERAAGTFQRRRKLQSGFLEKEPLQIPWRLMEALRQDGWRCRGMFPWSKGSTNSVANSDTGSCSHEYVLQMFRWDANSRPYLNCNPWHGSVLNFATAGKSPHRCPFPIALAHFLLGQLKGDTVIDPFIGSGTTAIAANALGMGWAGIDLDISLAQSLLPAAIAA